MSGLEANVLKPRKAVFGAPNGLGSSEASRFSSAPVEAEAVKHLKRSQELGQELRQIQALG